MMCKEALLWKQLNHVHVLPFLGLDAETFPGFFCMVSPWMRHGTALGHVRDRIPLGKDVTQLVRE
jgi:hypothetical protein